MFTFATPPFYIRGPGSRMKKFSDPGQNTISRIRDPGQNIPDPQYCPLISPPPHSTVGGAGDGGGAEGGAFSSGPTE
jgi:hypothetical protein